MVRGVARLARERQARLVPVARREPAEQLDRGLRRARVGVGRGDRPELLPRLPARAARPELAQPGGARGDAGDPALLEGARGRRLPRRRDAPGAQGPPAARQPAGPGLGRAGRRLPRAGPRVHDRPRRGAGGRRRDPRRDRRRAPVHGRGDRADRAARALLRRRRRGRAPAVQLPPDLGRLDAGGDRRRWSSATRPRCRRARGRTGCSATTTSRAWRAASAPGRRARPRCCC